MGSSRQPLIRTLERAFLFVVIVAALLLLGAQTARGAGTVALANATQQLGSPAFAAEWKQWLRQELPPLLAQHRVPAAAVAVVQEGRLVASVVVGEREAGKPAGKDTLFNVASLTKPVFAHAVLALVSQGRFALDEPLARHWIDPDVADDPSQGTLTARHVLSHQTGFPNWRDGQKLRFAFSPGEGVGYSGEGFDYLRRAVEAKIGWGITQLAAETVFVPFGMSDTHFVWSERFGERFAFEHDREGRRIMVPPKTIPSGADDLLTTIDDYGRFAAAVARGAGLPARLFVETRVRQIPARAAANANGPADYGLCWRVIETTHGTALMHGGADRGVRAGVIVVPATRSAVVVLTNGDNGGRIIEAVVTRVLPHGGTYLAHYAGRTAAAGRTGGGSQ